MEKVKIISVNYKTPDLIYKQYESVRKFYPNIYYHVVDGSDDNRKYFTDLEKSDSKVFIERFGYNIHHGPGMNHAIKNSKHNFLLVLDSDVTIKKELLNDIFDGFNGIAKGMKIRVNKEGVSSLQSDRTNDNNFIYPYVHPYCMLINRDEYVKYKPFTKHGAPCLNFMMDVFEKDQSDKLHNFNIEDYVNLITKGTRSRWGINL
jgi:hypothetical protein